MSIEISLFRDAELPNWNFRLNWSYRFTYYGYCHEICLIKFEVKTNAKIFCEGRIADIFRIFEHL